MRKWTYKTALEAVAVASPSRAREIWAEYDREMLPLRATALLTMLVPAAEAMKTVRFRDICYHLRVGPRTAKEVLEVVDEICITEKLPRFAVLVKRFDNNEPVVGLYAPDEQQRCFDYRPNAVSVLCAPMRFWARKYLEG